MKTKILTTNLLTVLVCAVLLPVSGNAESNQTRSSLPASTACSIYDAVYKPHPTRYPNTPSLQQTGTLDFTLTIHKPLEGEKAAAHRAVFFYIDAFDRATGKKVSTLRMADICGNADCAISTNEGQFRPNDEMKELKFGLGFRPIALRRDFSRTAYYGPDAPFAYILPDTAVEIYYLGNRFDLTRNKPAFDDAVSNFVKFYTPAKIFPDFGGDDVWLLDECDSKPAPTAENKKDR